MGKLLTISKTAIEHAVATFIEEFSPGRDVETVRSDASSSSRPSRGIAAETRDPSMPSLTLALSRSAEVP